MKNLRVGLRERDAPDGRSALVARASVGYGDEPQEILVQIEINISIPANFDNADLAAALGDALGAYRLATDNDTMAQLLERWEAEMQRLGMLGDGG
jgi:hypothetical protein